jgi:hypothetical protein
LYLGIPATSVVSPGNTAFLTTTSFTATAAQTTFTPSSTYQVGFINVIRNGSQLAPADFTATNGTTVVLGNACVAGDTVVTQGYTLTSIANALPLTGGTVSGNLTVSGTLTAAGGTSGFSGGFSNMQVFTSTGTFTVPAGITKVKVTVVGGGGGSGAARINICCQFPATAGGGGGGAAIEIISGLTPGGTVAVTVGAGGTAGSAGANGGTGGTSSFGAYCSATGGAGSPTLLGSGDFYSYSGGLGSGGDLNIRGGFGSAAILVGVEYGGGNGGASILAGGVVGFSGQYVNVGTTGSPYGGGAAGAKNQSGAGVATYAGGAGGSGVVIVEY